MKRRAFFGFLGGAAVSGPAVAKAAAADISSLALPVVSFDGPYPPSMGSSLSSNNSWAKDALKKLLGKSLSQKDYERKSRSIHTLDPGVASLRSVSLRHKIEMTRDIAYERSERLEEMNLRGHIKGWWS